MVAADLRKTLGLCFVCILCSSPPIAMAVDDIVGLDNLDLGLWTPASGNLSGSDDFCVAARLGNSQNPGRYAARVAPLASTVYELRAMADPAIVIPFAFSFQDLTDQVVTPLLPATFTLREQAGVRRCTGTSNARLIATVPSANITAAAPGEYQAMLQFTGQGIPSKTELSRTFSVRLRLSELIRISGLDSIDLGAFDGVRDRQGTDDFCVYSNGVTGLYTVTGYGQGSDGAFEVASGAGTLPFRLDYDDGGGLLPMTAGVPTQKANATRASIDCIGGNNANLRVTIEANSLRQAPSGTYVGEVTLIVAPI
jgi:hypothetical protein